ncbi:hypothetical protein V6N11_072721 [Hibiscus sabdariffa]|uniref:Uncharacterized protein n=2 Tax=Hibiscus sabdariffa TaxID=183260 RepID=A0ABR2NE49_9ROSI
MAFRGGTRVGIGRGFGAEEIKWWKALAVSLVTVVLSDTVGTSSFTSNHQFPAAKGFYGFQNPSETVGHWSTPDPDGKIHVAGNAEETLESGNFIDRKLVVDCWKEACKDLRAYEFFSSENSTSKCLFPAVAAIPIMSETDIWKQGNLNLGVLISRFLGILLPKPLIWKNLPLIKTSEKHAGLSFEICIDLKDGDVGARVYLSLTIGWGNQVFPDGSKLYYSTAVGVRGGADFYQNGFVEECVRIADISKFCCFKLSPLISLYGNDFEKIVSEICKTKTADDLGKDHPQEE